MSVVSRHDFHYHTTVDLNWKKRQIRSIDQQTKAMQITHRVIEVETVNHHAKISPRAEMASYETVAEERFSIMFGWQQLGGASRRMDRLLAAGCLSQSPLT